MAEVEPDSPVAHVFAAFAHYFEATLGFSDSLEESIERATTSAVRAIELDDPTGSAYMILGMIYLLRKRHDDALEAADKAMHDRPNCPWVYALKGALFNYVGKPAEAIEMARLAIRHTPLVPPIFPAVLATAHYLLGEYGAAVEAARQTIQLAPDQVETQIILAAALAAEGSSTTQTLQDIFRVRADFSLEDYARNQPYKDPTTLESLLSNLRLAGLS